MANNVSSKEPSEEDFKELKERCLIIFTADPTQELNDAALWRFLRAFRTADAAFNAIIKCNNWRREYGVEKIGPDNEFILKELTSQKMVLIKNRDLKGRPVIYIAARKHSVYERDINEFTKFIVYMLENACKRCFEDVIDNLCIVFDLKDFKMSCMDYEFVKNLIWLLSKYYPERLGVCLIINAPLLFNGCWSVIRPWLNDVTARKVSFVKSEMELCKYFNPDILPTDD
ncbi:uncharacterized protein LOC141905644 [Tubulanus polymorphus]|uniref:uncharacterized protein LOC141905644 n=1 Tax=Tubulanus polymorphus TaxID=672921 RepID=UPI003DA54852